MPLCNQTWVEDVFLCVGLLNECTQVGETHYGDRLVFNIFPISHNFDNRPALYVVL